MSKIKIIALFGKSGAGKDTIKKWLVEILGMNNIIQCTTRPRRDYEVDGVDYHFLTEDEFANKVLDYSMLEATCFRDWFYGTAIESLNLYKINVGVFNINGIQCLLQNSHLEIQPVFIQCDDKIRLMRCLNREQKPDCIEICRRFLADEKDFRHFDFNYKIYDNSSNEFFYPMTDFNWLNLFNK